MLPHCDGSPERFAVATTQADAVAGVEAVDGADIVDVVAATVAVLGCAVSGDAVSLGGAVLHAVISPLTRSATTTTRDAAPRIVYHTACLVTCIKWWDDSTCLRRLRLDVSAWSSRGLAGEHDSPRTRCVAVTTPGGTSV